MSCHKPVQTIDGSPLCSLCGVQPVPLCGCGDPMGTLCLVCNESEANERPNRDSETARLARMALCEHGIENAGAASPCGNCRARAGINVTEALMREGLAAQFEFSGIPPATLKAIIDALVTDAAFVAATKIGAERITEIVSRFT